MDYYRIGLFLRPHGIKGEAKLLPLTDDPKRFRNLSEAFIEAHEGCYQRVIVQNAKLVSDGSVIVSVEGFTTMDEAEKLRNKYLCVDRAHAVALPEGSYFVTDIIGCRVYSTDGEDLGVLEDVYETNANDVYVVRGKKKLSVPALKKLLADVDVDAKRIVFNSEVLSEVGLFED